MAKKPMPEEVKEALRKKRTDPPQETLHEAVQSKGEARKAVAKAKPKPKPEGQSTQVLSALPAKPKTAVKQPIGYQGRCRLNPDGAANAH